MSFGWNRENWNSFKLFKIVKEEKVQYYIWRRHRKYNKEESIEDIQGLETSITRARSNKVKKVSNNLIAILFKASPTNEELKPKMVNCLIQIEEVKEWKLHLCVIKF